MNIAADIAERFDFGVFHYRDMWHMREIENPNPAELKVVELLEALSESVNDVPRDVWCETEQLYRAVGADAYESIVINAIQAIGYVSFPATATEFLSTLNLTLEHCSA